MGISGNPNWKFYSVFETSLGRIAAEGTDEGIIYCVFSTLPVEVDPQDPSGDPVPIVAPGNELKKNIYRNVLKKIQLLDLAIPFITEGTTLQKLIWAEIANIPKGQTASYQDIANRIGRPKVARSVGTACSKNNIALIVPCHRVIRSNGTAGHYKWGDDLKINILQSEGVAISS